MVCAVAANRLNCLTPHTAIQTDDPFAWQLQPIP